MHSGTLYTDLLEFPFVRMCPTQLILLEINLKHGTIKSTVNLREIISPAYSLNYYS